MTLAGQNVDPRRYQVVPRTLSFLLRQEQVLLIRVTKEGHAWSGLLNGIGGHIECNEHPLQSAYREILEETGLRPALLHLAGVVLIDVGSSPGIGLYVFVGEVGDEALPLSSDEGTPEWHPLGKLPLEDMVADLPMLIPMVLARRQASDPFSALYTHDERGELHIHMVS